MEYTKRELQEEYGYQMPFAALLKSLNAIKLENGLYYIADEN